MAQYKVLQDIEADDKLLGPLSLRQFIYAIVVFVLGFVGFRLGTIAWYLALPFVPPMIFFGLLAAPLGRDQPSEVWLLAKIRFFFKARKRIWDQTGVKELVTITVPKKIERITSKGFSEQEVRSRLMALSATLDTRGWAVKNVDVATFQPIMVGAQSSDRLVEISAIAPATPQVTVDPASDILDEENNPVAKQVDQQLEQSTQEHRQELLDRIKVAAESKKIEQEFQAGAVKVAPISDRLQSIVAEIDKQQSNGNLATGNLPRLEPLTQTPPTTVPAQQIAAQQPAAPQTNVPVHPQTPVTPPTDPGILKLVKNNDMNVATLSREAGKQKANDSSDGEVVISLR